MAAELRRGSLGRARRDRDFTVVLTVRTGSPAEVVRVTALCIDQLYEASDPEAGPNYVGGPDIVSDAHVTITVDAGSTPAARVERFIHAIVRTLDQNTDLDVEVAVPGDDHNAPFPEEHPGPRARLVAYSRPEPPRFDPPDVLPPERVGPLADWLLRGDRSDVRSVHPIHLPLGRDGVSTQLERLRTQRRAGLVTSSTTGADHRWAELAYRGKVIAQVGAGEVTANLTTAALELPQLARALRVPYAYITPLAGPHAGFRVAHDLDIRSNEQDVPHLADEIIWDAFWYQIISAAHAERLVVVPPDAVELDDGSVELYFGELWEWLKASPTRDRLQRQARRTLHPLILSKEQSAYRLRERAQAAGMRLHRPIGDRPPALDWDR